ADAGIAEASPDASADSRLAAEIEPAVDHRIPGIGRPVDAEIAVAGECRACAGIQQVDECGAQRLIVDMAVPVAELTFEPEHPEVVTADRVNIETGVVVQRTEKGAWDVCRCRASRRRKRVADHRTAKGPGGEEVLALRPRGADVDP